MATPAEMPVTIPAAAPDHFIPNGVVTRVVLHDEEYPVSVHSAEDIAHYFASKTPGTSAHYTVDADSVEHCVAENAVAYHAPPNTGSIGIEHDGYARFTKADWATPGSVATLKRSAILTAGICLRHGIPVKYIGKDDLLAGKTGITFHRDVSNAWGRSTHQDPGNNFPITQYLAWVTEAWNAFVKPVTNDSPLLKLGSTGQKVKDVQHALNLCGNNIREDGVFGADTDQVLRVFQQHRGLPVTGTTDPATWVALRVAAHPHAV